MASRGYLVQDVVKVVVSKLPAAIQKDIDANIVIKTQEQLRLLERRAPTKLAAVDGKELRAACVLEYVFREGKGSGSRICTKNLATAVGTSKANFEKLHRMIGNFRGQGPELPLLAVTTGTRHNSQNSSINHPPASQLVISKPLSQQVSTIPRLAIRLSSLLMDDPHGFALKAQKLFDDIRDYVDTMEGARKRDQQMDIQRCRPTYEAACLYHVVSATQPKRSASRQQKQKQPPQSSLNNNNNSNKSHEEDPNRCLEIRDILDASPFFTLNDFKPVVAHVENLVVEMEKANEAKAAAAAKASSKRTTKRNTKGASNTDAKKSENETTSDSSKKRNATTNKYSSSKNKRAKSNDMRHHRTTTRKDHEHKDNSNQSFTTIRAERPEVEMPSLSEWRSQILSEACESARKELEKRGTPPEKLTESDLLDFAADSVLRQFGLLP